jgi:hypothetical protein
VIDEEEASGVNLPGYPADLHAVVVYQVRDGFIQYLILLM